jgi:hypothetical protein
MDKQVTEKMGNIVNKKFILPYLIGLFVVILFWDRNRRLEEVSSFFGFVAAILFIVANAYYPARLIAREFRPLPKPVVVFFRKYLKAHIWMNLVAFFAVTIHWHYAEEGNTFLTWCYILTVFLTIEGVVMHYRLVPGETKLLRMVHTQQALFVVWILLIVVGHLID